MLFFRLFAGLFKLQGKLIAPVLFAAFPFFRLRLDHGDRLGAPGVQELHDFPGEFLGALAPFRLDRRVSRRSLSLENVVLTIEGTVEIAPAGTQNWSPARPGQVTAMCDQVGAPGPAGATLARP